MSTSTYGVPTVPVLFEGAFDLDALLGRAGGATSIGDGSHIR